MIDVIIPSRNEAATVGPIVEAFRAVPKVDDIIVAIDSTTDNTLEVVKKLDCGYIVGDWDGKGQAIKAALDLAENERVVFCDADLTGFTATHAAMLTEYEYPYNENEIIGVPDFSPNLPWAHKVKDAQVWGDVSGERAIPTWLARNLDLHGYAMEVQINAAIQRHRIPFKKVRLRGVKGVIKPASYDYRVREWLRDLHWLQENRV